MRAIARFSLLIALAAGLAAVLSVPANAQQYPPPQPEEETALQSDLRFPEP